MHGSLPPTAFEAITGPEIDASILRAAIEATGESIVITSAGRDAAGPVIEYVNPGFTRMTGYPPEEAIGRSPRILQGPLTDRAVIDRLRSALMREEPFRGETINYRKDGSTYAVEWVIAPVQDDTGRLIRWVSAQRDVTERQEALEQQQLLVRELHHRVKNTLATVQAIMNSTARGTTSLADFQRIFSGRMASLAKTHALLTENQAQAVPFRDLLYVELAPYDDGGGKRIVLDGPPLTLPSELAVPLGMAVHEMTTNAVKHGALAEFGGRVAVTWSVSIEPAGPKLRWIWNEHDGPPVAPPTREGFGSRLLKRVLTTQIQAEVQIAYDPDGLRITVDVPLPSSVPV